MPLLFLLGLLAQQPSASPPASPLTFRVGDAAVTIGGVADAMIVTRSTATGNGIATSFGTIPFGNTPQGSLSENLISAQNSRFSLLATAGLGSMKVKGYFETDFLGNAPNGLQITTNGNTPRMRLFWGQVTSGKFEFVAGQAWSMLTPNRNGLSPVTSDVFISQNVDLNLQMGLTWTRAAQLRFVVHPSDTFAAGVALENPEQYVGSAVVLPAGFPAFEVDNGTVTTSTPDRYPDIIGKVAFDPKTGKTKQHVEASVIARGYRTYNPTTQTKYTSTGTGVEIAGVFELVPNLRAIASGYFSNGAGRYIANVNGPDFIVNPNASLTLVGSRSTLAGVEYTRRATLAYGYYGYVSFDQQVATDVDGTPIGFGVPGSTSANHTLHEFTLGVTQTIFRDPRTGALQVLAQYSNVARTPFSVPAGTPSHATLNMVLIDVRYILP
jgi:hypothetical protein